MMAVCNPSNPPEYISTTAEADSIKPQVNFTKNGGLIFPLVVCMPNTNVAESALVMKKVAMRRMVIIDKNVPKGKSL